MLRMQTCFHTPAIGPTNHGVSRCRHISLWGSRLLRFCCYLTLPGAYARCRCILGVYVLWWHDLCVPIFVAGGNHFVLAVVAPLRGVQVSPSLPWPSSPTRPRLPSRPGSHPVSAAQRQSTPFEMFRHHQAMSTAAVGLTLLRFTGRTGIRLAR